MSTEHDAALPEREALPKLPEPIYGPDTHVDEEENEGAFTADQMRAIYQQGRSDEAAFLAGALKSESAAIAQHRAQEAPVGWSITQQGSAYVVVMPNGGSCQVSEHEDEPRLIPTEVLWQLCKALAAPINKDATA